MRVYAEDLLKNLSRIVFFFRSCNGAVSNGRPFFAFPLLSLFSLS